MKHIAAMGAFALATLVAQARDITSLTLAQSGDDLTANVAFTAGETFAPVPFSSAVPEALRRPYLVETGSFPAYLPPTGMTILFR